jgi:hypothetical protein
MPAGMAKGAWIAAALAGLALVLPPASAQQQPVPPAAANALTDRTQCLAEADRFGQSLLGQVERGTSPGDTRDRLKSAVGRVQDALRDACTAINSPAAKDALATMEKLLDSTLQALRALQASRDGREMTDEQKRALDTLARELRLGEISEWLSRFAQSGFEQALREYDRALQFERFCFAGICIAPDKREPSEPPRQRPGEPDGIRL